MAMVLVPFNCEISTSTVATHKVVDGCFLGGTGFQFSSDKDGANSSNRSFWE